MRTIHSDITIIGGGLTGLTIAYLLREKNLSVHIVEARPRIGGRIFTKKIEGSAPQEMGATWLGKKHTALTRLLQELNLDTFEQILGQTAIYEPISTSPPQLVSLPPNSDPSYRIQGGSSSLIDALVSTLNEDHIHLQQIVKSIAQAGEFLSVQSNEYDFQSKIVISTLPPFLLTKTIDIQPQLPDSILSIAQQTHTWMGESIKVSLTYDRPFWREKNTSGTIFSNVGPIPEMYDHSNVEDTAYGLKGFLNGTYFSLSKEERLKLVMKQLEKYYGEVVRNFIAYEETVWRNELFTFTPYSTHVLPHQNNGHHLYQQSYLNKKLFIAGSETANNFPGYMEGAVRSALFVCQRIEEQLEA